MNADMLSNGEAHPTPQQMLEATANHCREDIAKISEPKAQALFETTAEVLIGLKTAYEHYSVGEESGMRR